MVIFDKKPMRALVDLNFATVTTAYLKLLLIFCELYINRSMLLLNGVLCNFIFPTFEVTGSIPC